MSVRTDEVQLRVTINGSAAKKELAALDQEAYQLREKMKSLKKGTEEYIAANNRLTEVEGRMASLRKEIGLNGLTLKQLNAELKRLNMIKQHLTPGTKAFNDLDAEVRRVQARITQVRTGMGPFQQAWKNLSGEVKGVAIAFAAMAGSQIISWFAGVIKGAGDLEDQLANIQKTTGMTTEQVKALNDELGRIDTRTSRKDLRDMAVVAGQMGFAGEEVLGFVKAVDMATVALGDEFTGGAEEVATVLGKLRNTLQDLKSSNVQMDLLHIGNAINELGAAGMATGPVVADFANRIGGYGIQAGLTSAQVLGLSATLQELGVTTERGGTAVVKILQKMFSNVDEFAKIAGLSVDDFQKMLNTDLFGAFTLVMQQSKAMGTNSVELNKIIQDLEVSGAGASEVFAKLGSNTEMLTEKVTLAGGAIKETSSITEEFNIKNATLGATIDKLKKDFNSLFTSEAITNGIKNMLYGVIKVVAILKELPNFVRDNKEAFKLLGAAIVVFNGQLILSRAATLADIAVKKIQEIWILRAEYAQAMLNRTMTGNPILKLIAVLMSLVAAYKIFTNHTGEARKAQEEFNAKVKEGQDLMANTGKIEDRFKIINKLSKDSLNQLKNDIEMEIQAYKDKDAEMLAWAWKNGVNTKLNELDKKFQREKDVRGQALIYAEIQRERDLIDAKTKAQFGYSFTEASETKKRLYTQQAAVNKRLDLVFKQAETEKEIEASKEDAVKKIGKKATDLKLKELTKNFLKEINARKDLQEDIKLALMDENDKEIYLAQQKWQKLIDQAKKYGIDTVELEAAMSLEILAIREKRNAKVLKDGKKANAEEVDSWQDKLNDIIGYVDRFYSEVSSIMNSISEISANNADKELQKYSDTAEAKKKKLDDQLAHGKISQENYNAQISAIDAEYREKEKAIKTEQFEKQKKASIIQASIDMALGIAKALGSAPPPYNFVLAALSAAAGAFQIAAISSQPIPEFAKGEEFIQGPGTGTSDSILARVSKGERIVPAHINEQLNGIPNSMLPKMLNFDFSAATGRRGGSYSGGEKSSYESDLTKVMGKKIDVLINEIVSLKKTVARKQDVLKAEVSITGRSGLENRQREYEEIKELAGR